MMCQKSFVIFRTIIALILVLESYANPTTRSDESSSETVKPENLMLTFENPADVPSAFFDSPPAPAASAVKSNEPRRISYPACQDGSGGLCVPHGQCPSDLKPEKTSQGACDNNQECCFGVPNSDTSCRNRGGECVATKMCGNAPKLRGTECSGVNGQVCCVWIF